MVDSTSGDTLRGKLVLSGSKTPTLEVDFAGGSVVATEGPQSVLTYG